MMSGLTSVKALSSVPESTKEEREAQHQGGVADHGSGDSCLGQGNVALMEGEEADEELRDVSKRSVQEAPHLRPESCSANRLAPRLLSRHLAARDAHGDLLGGLA